MDELAVVVDTDAWSHLFIPRRSSPPHVAEWRRLLTGRPVVIAAQTEAELMFGALTANWGENRLDQLREAMRRTPTIPVTSSVIEHHARLRAECRAQGHALADKIHMGDAWVAATARAYNLPLLAADGIYRHAPGLRLLADVT